MEEKHKQDMEAMSEEVDQHFSHRMPHGQAYE